MKHPFDENLIRKAGHYARKRYPNEMCGFITKTDFVPIKNIASDTINHFQIDSKEFIRYNDKIDAIVHSHADYPHLSKEDMEGQINSNIPWGVIFVQKAGIENVVFFGDQIPPYKLIGRSFIHGCFDCYGLARDYLRLKGTVLPIFPRDNLWWEKEPSLLEDEFENMGFKTIKISELKEGDIIFMRILSDVVNHIAIYLGDDNIMHHLYGRLSRRDYFSKWRKYHTRYIRYIGDN